MSVIKALSSKRHQHRKLQVLCFNDDVRAFILNAFGNDIEITELPPWILTINKALCLLHFFLPIHHSLLAYINPLNCFFKRHHGHVIFTSQDNLWAIKAKNIVVAVHDLMHRYEKRFPEVGGNKLRYFIREDRFSSIAKKATTIIVDSEVGAQQFRDSYKTSEQKVKVIPYPARNLGEPAKKALLIDRDTLNFGPHPFFFYPAQFWPHKNHARLIRSLKELHSHGYPSHLVLSGHLEKEYVVLKKLTIALGLEHAVHFVGYRNDIEVKYLYATCRALVFPTFLGPTNMPPLEAINEGCAVAVSGIYAMPEMLEGAALYFDPNSIESMTDALIKLHDDNHIELLKANGKKIRQKYSQKEFEKRIHEVIRAT